MSTKEFEIKVRIYVTPEEFQKHKHLLEIVPASYQDDYLNCLKYFSSMFASFQALDKVIELSKQLGIGTDDILELLPKFQSLIAILNVRVG